MIKINITELNFTITRNLGAFKHYHSVLSSNGVCKITDNDNDIGYYNFIYGGRIKTGNLKISGSIKLFDKNPEESKAIALFIKENISKEINRMIAEDIKDLT